MTTLEEVKAWLAEHSKDEDVLRFISEIVPQKELNAEAVAPYLETQDGQRLIQPYVDRIVDKAIKTYKENHYAQDVKSTVAAEILKLNPQETPEQGQIRELREAVERSEKERSSDKLRRQLVEEASKLGVEAFFIDDYLPASLDEGKLYLTKIKKFVEDRESKKVNEIMTNKGSRPVGGGKGAPDPASMSSEDKKAFYIAEAEKRLTQKER